MSKFLSFLKYIGLAVYHIIFPYYLFYPKYNKYIFVITTGRSGSGALANILKESCSVNVFHEPYPIMHNSLFFNESYLPFWNNFIFWLVKFPIIRKSNKNNSKIYLETNHMFIKSFSGQAKVAFSKKMKIISLKREPYKVAKSMYEIGKIPGSKKGNKWYLNPYSKNNLLKYNKIEDRINKNELDKFGEYYKCLWYWYEINEREKLFRRTNTDIEFFDLKTNDLNKIDVVTNKLSLFIFGEENKIKFPNKLNDSEKNKKIEEKSNLIDLSKAKYLDTKFKSIINS